MPFDTGSSPHHTRPDQGFPRGGGCVWPELEDANRGLPRPLTRLANRLTCST
ncbi:hypothetical protein LZ32DRAFT_601799, partial [Colletotrichum eremochloae]